MEGAGEESPEDNTNDNTNDTNMAASRKERRKAAKKEKRKKLRKEMAELARLNEEARLNDPEEQLRLQAEEEQERLRIEKERREFEEKERKIMEEWEKRKAAEQREEEERRRRAEEDEHRSKQNQVGDGDEVDDDGWEYVEEGPPEIIWQGNEIIVKKKRIRVKKKDAELQIMKEDRNRPTSNPLPPQSEVFAEYKDASSLSAQQLLENVAQETPNFGTEQDKAHCPFHLKTGACRFGSRCARIHFYPDKSCTLLIKNMYNGPGLAWEQDEGLEYTDEDVEHAYEEFYEDVHTEFLKFGEIVNFKVCRNGSSHLRGNVYVHYKSLDSAVLSYQSVNGRYFAGKQLQCEFVGVTRWKVAICGEFMKSRLQTCSRGMSCNFIHCFRNPGGDYEWADWDKPPPKYWLKKMASLFGYSDELVHDKEIEQGSPRLFRNSRRTLTGDADRSQSRENGSSRSSRNNSKDDVRTSGPRQCHRRTTDRKQSEELNDKQFCHSSNSREKQHRHSSIDRDSHRYWLERNGGRHSSHGSSNLFPACSKGKLGSQDGKGNEMNIHENNHEENTDKFYHHRRSRSSTRHREKSINRREESPSSDGSDEIELKSSKRQCTRRGRRSGEVEHDSESPSYSDRGHRNSESGSNHHSQTDGYQSERGEPGKQFHHHLKNSERKTDTSRIDFHKPIRSHATENVMEEDTDDRGRWEPEKGGDLSE